MSEARVTPKQRKGAVISAVTLAAMAIGVYLVVVLKFFAYQ